MVPELPQLSTSPGRRRRPRPGDVDDAADPERRDLGAELPQHPRTRTRIERRQCAADEALSPRERPEEQCAMRDALVARNADAAVHLHRSRPRRNAAPRARKAFTPAASPAAMSDRSCCSASPACPSASVTGPAFARKISAHRSGSLAARRVVSRPPGPNETPPSARAPSALGQRRRDGLRQVAGPCQLGIVRRGLDGDGLRLAHLLPEARDRPRDRVALQRTGGTDVDHRAAEEIGASRTEPAAVRSRQRVCPGKAGVQSRRACALHHRHLDAGDIGEDRTRREPPTGLVEELEGRRRRRGKHHERRSACRRLRRVGSIGDGPALQGLDHVPGGPGVPRDAPDPSLRGAPRKRSAYGAQSDDADRFRKDGENPEVA